MDVINRVSTTWEVKMCISLCRRRLICTKGIVSSCWEVQLFFVGFLCFAGPACATFEDDGAEEGILSDVDAIPFP